MEQTVEVAGSAGQAGSPVPGVKSTTSDVGNSVGEVRPFGTATHSATKESVFGVSSGEADCEVQSRDSRHGCRLNSRRHY